MCYTQVEHEISFKKFQPGKWAYLFRFSTFSWNFPVGRTDEMFPFSTEPKFLKIVEIRVYLQTGAT